MSDAKLIWFDFGGDIALDAGADLLRDQGLQTAVLISLFTDARAPAEAVLPQAETSRRGWWPDTAGQSTGSLLWLLAREKTTAEVAERAREYCQDALAWLTELDIAARVEVATVLVPPIGLQISITLHRGESKSYAYLWDNAQESDPVIVSGTSIKLQFV